MHFKKSVDSSLYIFGWVCYVILKKNISALTFLVSNSNCLKYLCVLTFLTYRFYILLNLTILSFYILFLECLIWLVLSTLCPFKILFHFSYLLSESFLLKGKQVVSWPLHWKVHFKLHFFSPLKTFYQKILKIWTNKKMKQIEKLFWTMSNLISLFWVEVNHNSFKTVLV